MPRGYNDYSFVIDSSFQPFSMQEMLVPFAMYKDEFEKQEAMLDELSKNTDTFKYLEQVAKDNPESKAAQIYNTYASDLKKYGDDFSANGLSMANSRGLRNMKRRYQGEIGRLAKAQTRLDEEMNLRRQMSAKDPSILYGTENLNIDNFLDDGTPNLYSISGTELYTKAATSAQALSKRIFSAGDGGSTLGGYYRDYVQKMGYTPEQLRQFGEQISTDFANWAATNIPELGMAANQILEANGVTENFKNNPSALRKAQQQVIRGLIDGAVYTESHNPTRDLGQMTAAEREQYAIQREQMAKSAAMNGLTWDNQTNSWKYNLEKDPAYQRQNALAVKKAELEKLEETNGTKKPATTRDGLLEKPLRISFSSSLPARTDDGRWQDVDAGAAFEDDYSSDIIEPENVGSGKHYTFEQLPSFVKRKIPANLDRSKHLYIVNEDNDTGGLGYFTPNKYTVTVVPVKTTISNAGNDPATSSTIVNTDFDF